MKEDEKMKATSMNTWKGFASLYFGGWSSRNYCFEPRLIYCLRFFSSRPEAEALKSDQLKIAEDGKKAQKRIYGK